MMKTLEDIKYVRQWRYSQDLKPTHRGLLADILFYTLLANKAKRKGRSRIQRRCIWCGKTIRKSFLFAVKDARGWTFYRHRICRTRLKEVF